MQIPWTEYFPTQNEGITGDTVFCPSDYKNVAGWTARVTSINKKHNANLIIMRVSATIATEKCGRHHKPIIGHCKTEFTGCRDDYYCSKHNNCWKVESNITTNVIIICSEGTNIDTIKSQINGKGSFTIV
jgi:hypothetical protein